MSYAETILPEFDQEMANTRKVLERIPDDRLDWQAHPKSHTIGWNANHVADIPKWLEMVPDDAVAGYRPGRRRGLYFAEAGQPTGDPRSLRPQRRRRSEGDRRGQGRGRGQSVDAGTGPVIRSSPCRARPWSARWSSTT